MSKNCPSCLPRRLGGRPSHRLSAQRLLSDPFSFRRGQASAEALLPWAGASSSYILVPRSGAHSVGCVSLSGPFLAQTLTQVCIPKGAVRGWQQGDSGVWRGTGASWRPHGQTSARGRRPLGWALLGSPGERVVTFEHCWTPGHPASNQAQGCLLCWMAAVSTPLPAGTKNIDPLGQWRAAVANSSLSQWP